MDHLVFIRHGGCYVKVHCSRVQVANINTENKTNSKHISNQPNQLNLKLSDNKFELEHKSKQYNDCCNSDTDDEVADNQNNFSSCDNLLPPGNHINDLLTPDCNTSPISLGQQNNKLHEPETLDYVSKLSEQLSNVNINDQITLNPDKNVLLNKRKLNFKKGQLVSYTLHNVQYTVEILNQAGKTTGSYKNSFTVEYKRQDQEENKKGYVDFDRVDDINILDMSEEIYQVDRDCFELSKQIIRKLETKSGLR